MARTHEKSQALASSNGWADSAEAWAERKRHNVVLPSGMKATIEIPELGMLVLANAVPDDLAELARSEITHELGVTGGYATKLVELGESEESREQVAELTTSFSRLLKWLVSEHVLVEPKVTIEELSQERFPLSDLDWLFGVAMRRVDEDALGRRLGVARLDAFATFPHEHGCAESCPDCLRARQALSTADLGAL